MCSVTGTIFNGQIYFSLILAMGVGAVSFSLHTVAFQLTFVLLSSYC